MRSRKLADSLKRIKRPSHILGTTYTLSLAFFESEVYPLLDKSHLKSCTIIADGKGYRNALKEGAALRDAGEGYLVVPAPTECFHAKVWIIANNEELLVVAGSGNLTQSGFMTNAEVFDEYHCTRESSSENMIKDLIAFTSGLANMWKEEDGSRTLCVEFIRELEKCIALFLPSSEATDESMRFLHSFAGPLIDQLPDVEECGDLYLAAPYFGKSMKGIELIGDRYPEAKKFVFPGRHPGDCIDVSKEEIRKNFPSAEIKVLNTWDKPEAFAHLKIYSAVSNYGGGWFFCTSANCTSAAWSGRNVEAGILRWIEDEEPAKFFFPSESEVPDSLTDDYEPDEYEASSVSVWASVNSLDTEFTLYVSEAEKKRLPLRDAEITIRLGSSVSAVKADLLFSEELKAKFQWNSFELDPGMKNSSICLRIEGVDETGTPRLGECFVENTGFLSLDPLHRRAWRGAESLFGMETLPEQADISQLFALLERGLTENAVGTAVLSGKATKGENETADTDSQSIAIWPPVTPEERDSIHSQIGSLALGRLDLYHKIIKLFLHEEKTEETSIPKRQDYSEEVLWEDGDSEGASDEDEDKEKQKAADQRWIKAKSQFERFAENLRKWIPEEGTAKNFWISATLTLLLTLKANRVAREKKSGQAFRDQPGNFVKLLLKEIFYIRKPKNNLIVDKSRGYGTESFPILSKDLSSNFGTRPPSECIPPLLAAVVDERFRKGDQAAPEPRHRFGPRIIEEIMGEKTEPEADLREKSLKRWIDFMKPGPKPEPESERETQNVGMTEEQFNSTYDELMAEYASMKR